MTFEEEFRALLKSQPGAVILNQVRMAMDDSPSVDAFGQLRTSSPYTAFEITHQYDLGPRLMGLQKNDSGTSIVHTAPAAVLSVPSTSGRRICHQSHRYIVYQPGRSHIVRMTGQLGSGSILAGMGYGDDSDGVFLERTNTGMQIRLSSSTIPDQLVSQSSWNVDKMDGSGVSGIQLNPGMSQHLVIDFQWLGVGRVRVGFSVDGKTHYAHYFHFSNEIVGTYTRTGSLPIRWYAESIGTAGSMSALCASVSAESGHDAFGQLFSYASATTKALGSAGVRTPLFSIRPKLLYAGLPNYTHIIPFDVPALVAAADNVLLEMVADGSLTGDTFAVVPNALSHAEIDTAATAISNGVVIHSEYLSSQVRISLSTSEAFDAKIRPLTIRANGTDRDVLTVCGTRIGGAASVFAGMNWLEV